MVSGLSDGHLLSEFPWFLSGLSDSHSLSPGLCVRRKGRSGVDGGCAKVMVGQQIGKARPQEARHPGQCSEQQGIWVSHLVKGKGDKSIRGGLNGVGEKPE